MGFKGNPLRRFTQEQFDEYFKTFHRDYDLDGVVDVTTLLRGARLARDQEAFVTEDDAQRTLLDVEAAAIEEGKYTNVWTVARGVKIHLLICTLGSVVQGWTLGSIVGASQVRSKNLRLEDGIFGGKPPFGDIGGPAAINAIAHFTAITIGAFLCDPLTDIFMGRRGAIFATTLAIAFASVGEAFIISWGAWLTCRCLLGIGIGSLSSIIPVYESEFSSASLQDQTPISLRYRTAIGVAFSGALALIISNRCQFPTYTSVIPAFVLLHLVYLGSESPRWLIKKQQIDKAFKVLLSLYRRPLAASRDLIHIWAQSQTYSGPSTERRKNGILENVQYINRTFASPRAQSAMMILFVIVIAQLLSSFSISVFLRTLPSPGIPIGGLGGQRNRPDRHCQWLTFGFGIANVQSSMVAQFYIDSQRRRSLLILSLIFAFLVILATTLTWLGEYDYFRQQGLIGTFLLLHIDTQAESDVPKLSSVLDHAAEDELYSRSTLRYFYDLRPLVDFSVDTESVGEQEDCSEPNRKWNSPIAGGKKAYLQTREALTVTLNWIYDKPRHLSILERCISQLTSLKSETISLLTGKSVPEASPGAGKTRVRWICICGQHLYDDFLETEPGAAAELRVTIRTSNQRRPTGQQSVGPNHSYPAASSGNGGPTHVSVTSGAGPSNSNSPSSALICDPRLIGQSSFSTNINYDPEGTWLLICAQPWRRPTSLLHLNVCSMTSDKQLFIEMRQVYQQLKKAWWYRLSLKVVRSIQFVQFELHPQDLVDVRKVPDMPPESRKQEYVYQPCGLIPPIGENLMTHLFYHPHHANERPITFLRSPKKRKQRLAICPQEGTSIGWGIHLVEGWAMTRIWLLAFMMSILGGTVFATTWSILEHDIQGAFAVAAYFVAVAGLGVGTMQAYINQM